MEQERNLKNNSMGAFDGAKVCELIGLYIHSTINESLNFGRIGLYRDDDLAVLKFATGSESERMKKRLIKTFRDNGLSIISHTNITANFLDISLILRSDTISKGISELSSTKKVFEAVTLYNEAILINIIKLYKPF